MKQSEIQINKIYQGNDNIGLRYVISIDDNMVKYRIVNARYKDTLNSVETATKVYFAKWSKLEYISPYTENTKVSLKKGMLKSLNKEMKEERYLDETFLETELQNLNISQVYFLEGCIYCDIEIFNKTDKQFHPCEYTLSECLKLWECK